MYLTCTLQVNPCIRSCAWGTVWAQALLKGGCRGHASFSRAANPQQFTKPGSRLLTVMCTACLSSTFCVNLNHSQSLR